MEIDSNKFAPIFYDNNDNFDGFKTFWDKKEISTEIKEQDFISIHRDEEKQRPNEFIDLILYAIEE